MQNLFYSVGEMSTILGVAEKTVYKWGPAIPGYIKIKGRVMFNRQTFLESTKGAIPKPERRTDNRHGV